jgi:hypothetical protein
MCDKELPFVEHVFQIIGEGDPTGIINKEITKYVAFLQINCAKQLIIAGQNRQLAKKMLNSCFTLNYISLSFIWWFLWWYIPFPLVNAARRFKLMLNKLKNNAYLLKGISFR